jgi:ABC-type nitrate/sulfonate/bicarbonate transport system permease component
MPCAVSLRFNAKPSVTPLAHLPLVIFWFGICEFAKALVIFLGSLPSIVISTNEGLRSVSPDRVIG